MFTWEREDHQPHQLHRGTKGSSTSEHASGEEDRSTDSPDKSPSPAPERSQGVNQDIAPHRRVVPVIEADEDVCSICLCEYTTEDPGNRTACKHCFHLQCVMQWAQRSRECPLCFKPLQLEDPGLNELLPFGEYMPPERLSGSAPYMLVGMDAWELERLLQRLQASGPGGTRRERRARARAPLFTTASPTTSVGTDRRSMGQEPAASSSGAPHVRSFSEEVHPSSWPPRSSADQEDHAGTSQGAAGDLRSRWAAVSNRCRESLQKTTRELKGRWSMGSRDRPPLSPTSAEGQQNSSHQANREADSSHRDAGRSSGS